MAEYDPNFEENVKNSFLKAKEHILELEEEIKENKKLIIEQNKEVSLLKEQIKQFLSKNNDLEANISPNKISTGNQGGLFIHSFNKHSFTKHTLNTLKKELNSSFKALTKQELLVFLTIYQIEEEKGHVTYLDLSQTLTLSEGCIRSYVTSLIKKGLPLIKTRLNNKIVSLSIPRELRDLNIKQKLENLYYKSDPNQTTLFEV